MNNTKAIATLKLTSQFADSWNEFLEPGCIIHDTKRLFIHAHRPYFDYYLSDIDVVEGYDQDLEGCRDRAILELVASKKKAGSFIDKAGYDSKLKARVGKAKNILVLTTPRRLKAARKIIASLQASNDVNYLLIDELVAEREIEPGWHLVREHFRENQPDLVLAAMGWERLVYLARFKKLFGLDAYDLGDAEFSQPLKRRIYAALKKIAKPVIKSIRK